VKLLDVDASDGVFLLERLHASTSLQAVDAEQAASIAATLLRRLAIPATGEFPQLQDHAWRKANTIRSEWLRHGCPFPETYISRAEALAKELALSSSNYLVNWDLHYDNVLAGDREPWLVIDPKVYAGDVEFGVAQLLWNRFDEAALGNRFDIIIQRAGLNREIAHSWTIVRCIDYWLWALNVGLTIEPMPCRIILEWLFRER
jgi:streptomycin 6-kinase